MTADLDRKIARISELQYGNFTSHRSAAALWGFEGGRRDTVEITCPRWRRAQHAGLVVHESKALSADNVTVVDAIPVTTPELTTREVLDRLVQRGRNGDGARVSWRASTSRTSQRRSRSSTRASRST